MGSCQILKKGNELNDHDHIMIKENVSTETETGIGIISSVEKHSIFSLQYKVIDQIDQPKIKIQETEGAKNNNQQLDRIQTSQEQKIQKFNEFDSFIQNNSTSINTPGTGENKLKLIHERNETIKNNLKYKKQRDVNKFQRYSVRDLEENQFTNRQPAQKKPSIGINRKNKNCYQKSFSPQKSCIKAPSSVRSLSSDKKVHFGPVFYRIYIKKKKKRSEKNK